MDGLTTNDIRKMNVVEWMQFLNSTAAVQKVQPAKVAEAAKDMVQRSATLSPQEKETIQRTIDRAVEAHTGGFDMELVESAAEGPRIRVAPPKVYNRFRGAGPFINPDTPRHFWWVVTHMVEGFISLACFPPVWIGGMFWGFRKAGAIKDGDIAYLGQYVPESLRAVPVDLWIVLVCAYIAQNMVLTVQDFLLSGKILVPRFKHFPRRRRAILAGAFALITTTASHLTSHRALYSGTLRWFDFVIVAVLVWWGVAWSELLLVEVTANYYEGRNTIGFLLIIAILLALSLPTLFVTARTGI